MSSFAQFINFIMEFIDFIKRLFGGSSDNDEPEQDGNAAS